MAEQKDDHFKRCLEKNKEWAAETVKKDPDFFKNLAKGQAPEILWIGCADARKPETVILGLQPGDVFTHRNIANIVHPTDLSLLSVIEFSVRNLKVNHVVVCGHTSCGGVNGALGNGKLGIIDAFITPLRQLREQHAEELDKLEGQEKSTYLAKLNIKSGVEKLRRMDPILEAMRDRGLQVHGVLYDLATGLLEDLDVSEGDKEGKKRRDAFETK